MSLMATMNIKDPEVHRLAKTLAAARRTSAAGGRPLTDEQMYDKAGLPRW